MLSISTKQPRQNDSDLGNEAEKRHRYNSSSLGSPFNPDIFEPKRVASLKQDYADSFPYPHVQVRGLLCDDRARGIEAETKCSLKADFKETDLFKVYQTPDLANLVSTNEDDSNSSTGDDNFGSTTSMASQWRAPQLVALRDAIYSKTFREFVSELSGCGDLEDKADCSCNAYVEGGHLLCHDDVINTRRISYIIYLTDPEESWSVQDGGALELYPLSADGIGCPDTTPVKNILPEFNSMVFFTVVPGESFHAVQEVFTAGKPRLSISGWFHGKEPPPGMENATRAQLSGVNADATTAISPWVSFTPRKGANEDKEDEEEEELDSINLLEEDVTFLSKYINPQYLDVKVLTQLRDRFLDPENGSAVQLDEFLIPEVASNIRTLMVETDRKDKLGFVNKPDSSNPPACMSDKVVPTAIPYEAGVGNGWKPCGPVHKQRFLHFEESLGAGTHPLHLIRMELIESAAFRRWISEVTCFSLLQGRSLTRRFRPGLDYTVAHVGTLAKKGSALDATLCFVDDGMQENKFIKGSKKKKQKTMQEKSELWHLWDSGEVGGFECYIEVDEPNEGDEAQEAAPEVYDNRSAREFGEGKSASAAKTTNSIASEEEEEEFDSEDEEEAGGTLLSVQARFNTLSLVTRDEGVMRFVKFVSAFAPGSRWDIATEYQVE